MTRMIVGDFRNNILSDSVMDSENIRKTEVLLSTLYLRLYAFLKY